MQLGRGKHEWPSFRLPRERGTVTVIDVMAREPGSERDQTIDAWCASVWEAYHDSHRAVEELLVRHEII